MSFMSVRATGTAALIICGVMLVACGGSTDGAVGGGGSDADVSAVASTDQQAAPTSVGLSRPGDLGPGATIPGTAETFSNGDVQWEVTPRGLDTLAEIEAKVRRGGGGSRDLAAVSRDAGIPVRVPASKGSVVAARAGVTGDDDDPMVFAAVQSGVDVGYGLTVIRHSADWRLDTTPRAAVHDPPRADDPQRTTVLEDPAYAVGSFSGNWAVFWQHGTDEWSVFGHGDEPLVDAVRLAESIATASYGAEANPPTGITIG